MEDRNKYMREYNKRPDVVARKKARKDANPRKYADKWASWAAAWRAKNPERWRAYQRGVQLKRKYGITTEEYDAIFASQGGVCAVCKGTDVGRNGHSYMPVDHDHASGYVRGILCNPCNKMIGHGRDNIGLFELAIAYLKRSQL